jgi:predicted RecA/RadA family phage recombinase
MPDVISSMVRPALLGATIVKVAATREKSGVRVISGHAVAIFAVPAGAFGDRIR